MHSPSEEESQSRFGRLQGNCRFYLLVPFEDTCDSKREISIYSTSRSESRGCLEVSLLFWILPDEKWKYTFANYLVLDVTIVRLLRFWVIPDIFSVIILIFVAPGNLIQYEGGLKRTSEGSEGKMTHTMASACLYPRIAFYFDSCLLLLNKIPIAKKSYSTFKKGVINPRGFI